MEHEDVSDHEETAAAAEHEGDDLKRQGDKLDEDIEAVRDDWEHKKQDSGVPGAVPDPGEEGATGQTPEGEQHDPAEDGAE